MLMPQFPLREALLDCLSKLTPAQWAALKAFLSSEVPLSLLESICDQDDHVSFQNFSVDNLLSDDCLCFVETFVNEEFLNWIVRTFPSSEAFVSELLTFSNSEGVSLGVAAAEFLKDARKSVAEIKYILGD